MIVVLGRPQIVGTDEGAVGRPGGPAVAIAMAVAAQGEPVELVGSIGDDPEGDMVALALGQAGVGHAALLRDPAARTPRRSATGLEAPPRGPTPRLDADDVGLALRYLPACRVLVIADELEGSARTAAVDGAAYHGATVIAVVASAEDVNDELRGAIVLLAPEDEADSLDAGEAAMSPAFEAFVAECAVRIARGARPETALAEAAAAGDWEPSSD